MGIDLERRDRENKTPLIVLASRLSSQGGNENLRWAMKQLLNRRVDPNAQDASGRTALHYLCDPKSFSPSIFEAIVDLIGTGGISADVLLSYPSPPPPPPGARSYSPSPDRAAVTMKRRGRRLSRSPIGSPRRYSSPSLSPVTIIRSEEPVTFNNTPITARVDICDKTRETALQAFFRNLTRTHNVRHATAIAIRMLSLTTKDELDRQSATGSRLFNLAIMCKNDKLIQELYNLGVNVEERDSTPEHRSPL